mmetsp:Transcript_982/g.2985  ORF Transcript_982/g.2985 Transcript_982/m.2985 type:complete len:220 (-) Transcript_982:48-707(-)
MRELRKGRGGEVERQRAGHAQELRRHVDLADVHEDPRPHGDALEGQVVVPERDLVVAAAGVVAPGLRLHRLPRHGLEVKCVQHRRQRGLHELLERQLLAVGRRLPRGRLPGSRGLGRRRLRDVLLPDGRRVHDAHRQRGLQQLVHDVLGVHGVEERRRVLAGVVVDELRAPRVHPRELCQVVGLAVKHDPAVLLRVVLRHLVHGESRRRRCSHGGLLRP